jgi:hypothetical protein
MKKITSLKVTMDGEDATGLISDGYHTFDELYEHRIALFIALCRIFIDATENPALVWRSKLHADGTMFEGWFILGMDTIYSGQITYHLPLSKWEETSFAETRDKAPEWDGHTPDDVLERLKKL